MRQWMKCCSAIQTIKDQILRPFEPSTICSRRTVGSFNGCLHSFKTLAADSFIATITMRRRRSPCDCKERSPDLLSPNDSFAVFAPWTTICRKYCGFEVLSTKNFFTASRLRTAARRAAASNWFRRSCFVLRDFLDVDFVLNLPIFGVRRS